MLYFYQKILEEIRKEAEKAQEGAARLVEKPRKGFGDFALPCFAFGGNPVETAQRISEKIKISGAEARAEGPYVNFYINWSNATGKIIKEATGKRKKTKKDKTALIDYSHPNPAHPFHMGTVRTTLLGEALARILESEGWIVKRIPYMNDLGRQAMLALLGYMKYANGKKPQGKEDVWLGGIYFRINKEVEGHEKLERELSELIKKYETGDAKTRALGKRLFSWCINGFEKNYKTLGIKFDGYAWESAFAKESKKIVKELMKKGYASEKEGAIVLDLEGHGLPSTIIQRSDGTGLYLTRELAHTLWRFEKHKPDLNLYVVAEDQKNHFMQLFKTLELLGYKDYAEKSRHISYSIVLLEGEKMSARRGHAVLWDDLLDEGIKLAGKEIKRRWKKMRGAALARRAKEIALGAIIYYILRYEPNKPVNFLWQQALAFEGNTGPYLQYTHTRANAILKKVKAKKISGKMSEPAADEEINLIRLIAQYPAALQKAAEAMQPHVLCNYLYSLAEAFNSFYEKVPVLKAENEERKFRLALVQAVENIMKDGLHLLAIPVPERM
ncbi:MAG: arginine--tRNA ligase [Candidatus Aenigmarchaeota archaeon]|nr:arginine--tRNA ligase [Candidatus Aenigmarchaeota archaeon]